MLKKDFFFSEIINGLDFDNGWVWSNGRQNECNILEVKKECNIIEVIFLIFIVWLVWKCDYFNELHKIPTPKYYCTKSGVIQLGRMNVVWTKPVSVFFLGSLNIVFFPENFVIFLNSVRSAAALLFYLPCMCTYTGKEGKQRKARVWNILKSSEKTQYLMNTL